MLLGSGINGAGAPGGSAALAAMMSSYLKRSVVKAFGIARGLEHGGMATQHPMPAIARCPEHRRCLMGDFQGAGMGVGEEAGIAKIVEIIDQRVGHMIRPGD